MPLVAHQNMKEFDPQCERHHPLLIIKAVNPGCTLELQIENAVTGEVIRLTSTEDAHMDKFVFHAAILKAFEQTWSLVKL